MDRRSFLKNTGWSFLGLAASGSLLGSCVAGSKEAKKIMEQHIKYYLDHDIYSIDDAIATYRLENEENMSRDKAIATAQYATQVMNGEDVNKMTAKRKKEYKDTFIPKFIENGSKNPEEDVEKVFDNVSKFYLLKK